VGVTKFHPLEPASWVGWGKPCLFTV